MTMTTTDDRSAGAPDGPRKGTLFCPDCDHSSRFDGDWRVVETGRGLSYRCPDCGVELTTRRRGDRERRDTEGDRGPTAAWRESVRAWGRVWLRAVVPARD
jgi:hypothetical protein